MPPINQITADIIDASIHLHADLGPGLFESAYEELLAAELKCTERSAPIHQRQLLTYLRLMKLPVGLLINFGGDRLIDGVQRIMNGYLDGDERVDVHR